MCRQEVSDIFRKEKWQEQIVTVVKISTNVQLMGEETCGFEKQSLFCLDAWHDKSSVFCRMFCCYLLLCKPEVAW